MSDPQHETALARLASQTNTNGLIIEMSEVAGRGMIDLRGLLSDRKFAQAAKTVLGIDLPKAPRTSASNGDLVVLWLSVDQWLIICAGGRTTKLLGDLNKALAGIHSLAVDLSDARTIIRLKGNGVREVLMKGAPVDLLAPEMVKGAVRRLRFGEIAAMVHIVDDRPDTFELYVFRSYADFAWDWLAQTAAKPAAVKLFGRQDSPAT
ncbi:MAG: hypothetical protein OER56_01065 [Hyphomicrobiales bacterium]|nr:hypothetical protein [Hyphomicrobiales bacterium]